MSVRHPPCLGGGVTNGGSGDPGWLGVSLTSVGTALPEALPANNIREFYILKTEQQPSRIRTLNTKPCKQL